LGRGFWLFCLENPVHPVILSSLMSAVISIENVCKSYRLGVYGSGTLREDLQSWWHRVRGLPDPNRRVDQAHLPVEGHTLWALQDVSLAVEQGDVLGIIGRNGAGKSTLLKILSRVTAPTSGRIRVKGRVASLLEVGTGFHPELTGRENIFLNGAILGMTKAEVARKFDEIVAFSEIEAFIDTPVKRYSSGMYVRLAFAVAAHLDPEILVVDEVLAVGDAAFQKKCVGKMGDVARGGRTVLFVSHNMQAVSQITSRAVVLDRGTVAFQGLPPEAIAHYMTQSRGAGSGPGDYVAPPKPDRPAYVERARVVTSEAGNVHAWGRPLSIELDIRTNSPQSNLCIGVQIVDDLDRPINYCWLYNQECRPGLYRFECRMPKLRLYMGRYSLVTWLADWRGNVQLENLRNICSFEVSMHGHPREYAFRAGECYYLEDFAWSPMKSIG
jgi:lipopolysaccharide transport system ATP-binding protein